MPWSIKCMAVYLSCLHCLHCLHSLQKAVLHVSSRETTPRPHLSTAIGQHPCVQSHTLHHLLQLQRATCISALIWLRIKPCSWTITVSFTLNYHLLERAGVELGALVALERLSTVLADYSQSVTDFRSWMYPKDCSEDTTAYCTVG